MDLTSKQETVSFDTGQLNTMHSMETMETTGGLQHSDTNPSTGFTGRRGKRKLTGQPLKKTQPIRRVNTVIESGLDGVFGIKLLESGEATPQQTSMSFLQQRPKPPAKPNVQAQRQQEREKQARRNRVPFRKKKLQGKFKATDFVDVAHEKHNSILYPHPEIVTKFLKHYKTTFSDYRKSGCSDSQFMLPGRNNQGKVGTVLVSTLSASAVASYSWKSSGSRRRLQSVPTDSAEFKAYPLDMSESRDKRLNQRSDRQPMSEAKLKPVVEAAKKSQHELLKSDRFVSKVRRLKPSYTVDSQPWLTEDSANTSRKRLKGGSFNVSAPSTSRSSKQPVFNPMEHMVFFPAKPAAYLRSKVSVPDRAWL